MEDRTMTTTMERTADVLHEAVGDRLVEVASTAVDVMRGAGEVVRDADRTLRGSPEQVLGLVAALGSSRAGHPDCSLARPWYPL
jgi:hypothetical protein